MGLTVPILLPVTPFDATSSFTFTFNVVGGNQVTQNKLTIRNNVSNTVVYSEIETGFKYEHTVPMNTLTNGTYYNAYLNTYDAQGNISGNSNIIQFYCYTSPTIKATNIVGGAVNGPSYNFEFTYDQNENEPLNSYNVMLYDSLMNLIAESGNIYPNSTTVPLDFEYTFNGFENNTTYNLLVNGVTLGGTVFNSPTYNFVVSYSKPSAYALNILTNNCEAGYITVQSNITRIIGEVFPPPPIFITNSELDLTAQGSYLEWNEGFALNGDFTCLLKCRALNDYSNIVQFIDENNNTINVNYFLGLDENFELQSYAVLEVTQDNQTYHIYSPYTDPPTSNTSDVYIWFRAINNLYEIYLTIDNQGG